MLPLAAIRVLVVLASETADESATLPALERALRGSLGGDAIVSVEKTIGPDESVLAREATARAATLLCVVAWSDRQERAKIHFYRPEEGRWSEREIRFDPADAGPERGRTLGFAMASMVPDEALAPRRLETPASTSARAARAMPADAAERGGPAPARPVAGRHAVEVFGQGAGGIGGSGGGSGGGIAARLGLSGWVHARVAVSARISELAQAQATSRSYAGGLGIAWARPIEEGDRFRLGVRLDALLLAQQVVHLSADDPAPDSRLRLLPGASAAVEGTWRFAGQAAAMIALGPEVAFGATDVLVHGRKVVELVPVRAFAEGGLRVAF